MRMILEVEKVHRRQKCSWQKWFNQSFKSFQRQPLEIISGVIPQDLKGILLRNSTSCFIRNKQTLSHLYDGDGGIMKFQFDNGEATAQFELINTKSYKKEQKIDKFTEYGWGINQQDNFFKKMFSGNIKNTANSSLYVFPHTNKIIALGYYGRPYSLNLDTLETIGEETFDGKIKQNETLGQYFKQDPQTGKIYNFGYTSHGTLILYEFDQNGNITNSKQLPLDDQRILIQDFCIAGDYIIFFRSPKYLSPLNIIPSSKVFWDSISYDIEKGTEMLIFNKNTFEQKQQSVLDPFFSHQFVNGFQNSQGNIELEILQSPDFRWNRMLKQITGGVINESGYNQKLTKIIIDPRNAMFKEITKQSIYPCNNATFDKSKLGMEWEHTYLNVNDKRKEFDIGNNIAKVSRKDNQTLLYISKEKETYLGEPVLTPDNKYVISVGLNCEKGTNEIHILDSQHLQQLCVLQCNELLPFSTLGQWVDYN